MIACPSFAGTGMSGIAGALRAVDCQSAAATAYAFGQLFGSGGRLLPAMTLLLTLYIAFFAIGLLTGRSRLGIGTLTPRMLTLGLVLTFATSWVAYQNVVWTLASGAPDQIAGLLAGTRGSATNGPRRGGHSFIAERVQGEGPTGHLRGCPRPDWGEAARGGRRPAGAGQADAAGKVQHRPPDYINGRRRSGNNEVDYAEGPRKTQARVKRLAFSPASIVITYSGTSD